MKKGIFEGKSRQKVLYTLYSWPTRYFSVRELAEINHSGPASVKRTLQDFSKYGLLRVAEKKGERYYGIDRRSGVFAQLAEIFGKQKFSQKDVVGRILRGFSDLRLVALTGIYVGLVRADIDLLLVGTASQKKVERTVAALSKLAGCEINYALMTEKEFRDRLYSFDWFLKEVMDHAPVILVDKISKHRKAHGPRVAAVFSNIE
ncbi:MAG: hypothetical protein M1275_02150 [Patescibacteria group bacterium]|nr:hypothetical protein [Patescibacteria group bacterium]